MPSYKGAISGMILGGYNFGPVPFLLVFTYIANPDNHQADVINSTGEINERYFGEEVTERIPMTIRWNAIMCYLICLIGIACLPRKTNGNSTNENEQKHFMSVKTMLTDYRFWHLSVLLFFGSIMSAYFLNMYKIIGMIYINDDHFLAYVGSFLFLFGSIGRISFGILMDKFSWKLINSASFIIQSIITLIICFNLSNKIVYGSMNALLGFFSSSIYIGVLIQSERLFPKDKWIISYITLSFIPVFFTPYIAQKFITPAIGYNETFYIITATGIIATILAIYSPKANSIRLSESLLNKQGVTKASIDSI